MLLNVNLRNPERFSCGEPVAAVFSLTKPPIFSIYFENQIAKFPIPIAKHFEYNYHKSTRATIIS